MLDQQKHVGIESRDKSISSGIDFKAVCAAALLELTLLFVCHKGAREARQKEYISGKGPGTS